MKSIVAFFQSQSPATVAVATTLIIVASTAAARNPTMRELARTFGSDTGLFPKPIPTRATEICPPGSRNCVRATLFPPKGPTVKELQSTLQTMLEQYPQSGQGTIDQGGWSLTGKGWKATEAGGFDAHVEFKSGIGKYAKRFNGGKPFVDDLLMEIVPASADAQVARVEMRSSSRKGFDDIGVNKKRVNFLIDQLPKDWERPEVKCAYE